MMFDLEGTFRARKPQETLEWIQPLLKKFGIARVADITGLDRPCVYVYQAIRPFSKGLSVSQGKGTRRDLAKISAVMEAIELWHAENVRPPDLYGSFSELSSNYPMIKPACHLDTKMFWIKAVDLFTNKDLYVPYNSVNMDCTLSLPASELLPRQSTGLAAGNTFEEALCHALYEVIERDARFQAQENLLSRSVELDTIDCHYIQQLIKNLKKEKFLLLLIDVTSEFQIPSYSAYIFSTDPIRSIGRQSFVGAGTHLSKETAVSRAITEAVQTRLAIISGARDDLSKSRYEPKGSDQAVRFYIQKMEKSISFGSSETIPSSFAGCMKKLLDTLKKNGIEQAAYFDYTLKDYGVPVVRAIVPGLKCINTWLHHGQKKNSFGIDGNQPVPFC